MKRSGAVLASLLFLLFAAASTFSQGIPEDPNHLPKMIGGQPGANSRVDSITVTGKVRLEGLAQGQAPPSVFVAVYSFGRFVARRPVTDSGSYSIGDIPREGLTIVVEIDHNEVASRQIIESPSTVVFQDFSVNLLQVKAARPAAGVVDATAIYERNNQNQDRFERAVAELKKGKNDNAITLLNTIVGEDSKDYYAWTQLGNAYFLKKDYKNAENAYRHAVAERPTYTLASVNLGKLYLSQNNFDAAIELLTRTVATDPASADAQQYLGEAYLGIKKGSKAVGYLNEAIRLAPIEKAEIHLRLAALYNGAGLKPRASAEYQKFLEKVPNYERRDELKKYIAENPPAQ